MGRLDGKVAIVTGAARGMGAETARVFVREGARVVLTDVLDDPGEQTAKELGESARYLHLDVTDEAAWSRVVTEGQAVFGRIDVLINNAGILHTAPVLECEPADFRKVIDVNLVGPYLGIRAVAPVMAKTGGGSIVNISSVQGLMGRAGTPAYTASKFGVRGLTKTVALELGVLGIRLRQRGVARRRRRVDRGLSGGFAKPLAQRLSNIERGVQDLRRAADPTSGWSRSSGCCGCARDR